MITTEELKARERKHLKAYAFFSDSIERTFPSGEKIREHSYRTEFQRDRDRIIHSKSFRRLEYKTQVFLTQKNDHYRTRLTHSLEVAQLSKTIALQLGLNCDLVEAIALGHDVGHTPFGHAGERALKDLLADRDIHTFKHNVQSVRELDLLEIKYDYPGLRLTVPVKEGIIKHTELPKEIPLYCNDLCVDKPFSVTLEGQVVAIADEIAQLTHDMDDYLRFDIISYESLRSHDIFEMVDDFIKRQYRTDLESRLSGDNQRKKDTIIRCLVDFLVTTLIAHSEMNLAGKELRAFELDQVYIDFREDNSIQATITDFKDYTEKLMLNDYRVVNMDNSGKTVVFTLFSYYEQFPDMLPTEFFGKYKEANEKERPLIIADYIAGMTDRYAIDKCRAIIKEMF